jgi:NAD(P)-dependent dehydrogenase (short-subunit alcohol dehydrogenase family)
LPACDHGDDVQVAALFERVRREHGRLDILVNCAIAIPDALTVPGPFWQKPLEMTGLLDVGLRSTYVASHCAAGLLIAARGLVVNISSAGSRCCMHGPAWRGQGRLGQDELRHGPRFQACRRERGFAWPDWSGPSAPNASARPNPTSTATASTAPKRRNS